MQSLPIVSLSFDTTLPLSETNLDSGKVIFSLSEPAPMGGLAVNFNSVDGDGIPGDIDVSIVNGTLLFNEDNSFSGFLIDEGVTEARFDIAARQDNISEGEEITTITLLPGEGYTIEPEKNIASYIITDLPVVTFSVDKTIISEGGEPQNFTLQLNEPAPEGGLTVRLQGEDSDTDPADPIPAQQLFNNISNVELVRENGNPVFEFTIVPGAISANFGLLAVEDNKIEGDETFTLTLLDEESYSVDSELQSITTKITDKDVTNEVTDLPIVTFNVDRTVISEGEEKPQVYTFQLNEPALNDGLTVRLQLEDPDGDFSDGGFPPELFNNISGLDSVVENGNFILEYTISPGVTEASFGFLTGEDNKVEGDETFTLTLLDDESYSVDSASEPIVSTVTEKTVINRTSDGENLFGTHNSEFIIGNMGNDTIFGNGGEDNLIGNEGDDLIYGGSQADTILAGNGNDTIFGNGGGDLINSGTGDDTVWLGAGEATVILETGAGFDTVNNFQFGSTIFQVESKDNLSFIDSNDGAKIFQGDDLLAVVSWQLAHTFTDNQDSIFTVAS
ncbi:MAG: calcium-binding protein [Cyanobacteria bacterium P01_A01_bin.68]